MVAGSWRDALKRTRDRFERRAVQNPDLRHALAASANGLPFRRAATLAGGGFVSAFSPMLPGGETMVVATCQEGEPDAVYLAHVFYGGTATGLSALAEELEAFGTLVIEALLCLRDRPGDEVLPGIAIPIPDVPWIDGGWPVAAQARTALACVWAGLVHCLARGGRSPALRVERTTLMFDADDGLTGSSSLPSQQATACEGAGPNAVFRPDDAAELARWTARQLHGDKRKPIYCGTLAHDVFTSSVEAIDLLLAMEGERDDASSPGEEPGKRSGVGEDGGKYGPSQRFSPPTGTTWSHVGIVVTAADTAKVTVWEETKGLTFAEMGFKDNRTAGKSDKQWEALCLFAKGHGFVTWKGAAGKPLFAGGRGIVTRKKGAGQVPIGQKCMTSLRKKLRALCGLDGDPFEPYDKKAHCYRSKFAIEEA